jgi:hypothetical protein
VTGIVSAIRMWGRGPVLAILVVAISFGCSQEGTLSGPETETDPFRLFDAVSPPVPGIGAAIPNGHISAGTRDVLTKPTGKPRSKSKKIKAARGGSISIMNWPTYARLTVLEGAIHDDVTIDVTVLGSLGSIAIEFGPDGQTFSPAAVLDIVRPIENLDPDDLKLFLTSADGSVEQLQVEVMKYGKWMRVRTWISHFSAVGDEEDDGRYSDEENPES